MVQDFKPTPKLIWESVHYAATDERLCIYNDYLYTKTKQKQDNGSYKTGYVCLTLDGEFVWDIPSASVFTIQPAIKDGRLIFGDRDGFVYGVNPQTGDLLWRTDIKPHVHIKHIARKRRIVPSGAVKIVGTTAILRSMNQFVGIDAITGQLKWVYKPDGLAKCEACDESCLYFVTSDSMFCCVDVETGQLLWQTDNSQHQLYSTNAKGYSGLVVGNYYFATFDNEKLVAFDRNTGQVVWEFITENPCYAAPSFIDGKLVVADNRGFVYCFE